MPLFLGRETEGRSPVELPVEALNRHFVALGGSGSGKTVLCKCVMEEGVRNNIPLIIVDPQGDIASLASKGNREEIEMHGTPLAVQDEFFSKARVAIFTPASAKAIPISVNPIRFPPKDTLLEEAILALDMTASSVIGFLGYDLNTVAGKGPKAYLYTILQNSWQEGKAIKDMGQLADIVLNPPATISSVLSGLLTKNEVLELARKLRFLTVGTPSLMFNMGVQIDIDMFMDRVDGKVPVNIVYLNTLRSANDKQFFLATLLRELYCWMLRNPSEQIQLMFYIDEIAPYIPPYPRNPPSKEAYSLLFKQARKYGIGLVAATQNVTDIDYKALAQVNTWCLGRMMTTQDIGRVQKIIQSIDPAHADLILQRLPSLRTGEFLMLSPDFYDDVVDFQVRWLATKHLTLDENDLASHLPQESKAFFERHLQKNVEPPTELVAAAKQHMLKPIEQRIQLFLSSTRRIVSAESIAQALETSIEDAERALRALIKSNIVKKGHAKGSSEDMYWLSKFGFDPSKNIVGEILVVPARITQVEAMKKVKPMLEGGFLAKNEEIVDAEFSYLPIWRIMATREARKLLLFKKEEADEYYLEAKTGALVTLEKKEIALHKLLTNDAGKLKSFADDEDITFVPKLPSEIEDMPKINIGMAKITETLRLKLGAQPISAEITLLPMWTMTAKHKKKPTKRTIIIDAATGRTLAGYVNQKETQTKAKRNTRHRKRRQREAA